MKIQPALLLALTFAVTAELVGCTSVGKASDASASDAPSSARTVEAAATSPVSKPYPDWAAAVVPDYPARIDQQSVTDDFYQIDSPDDIETVAAWFKTHTNGGTWKPSDADSPEEYFFTGPGGVKIDIQENHYPGKLPGVEATKTMIAFTRSQR